MTNTNLAPKGPGHKSLMRKISVFKASYITYKISLDG